ncbi:MAG: molybdopterin molybdenumtransferase MoeA, partial [Nitrospirales bacterium]|nr:molybdopterin molybdenumtransferase MoeA [Nitrospirales bacterium]
MEPISYREAFRLTLERIGPLPTERVPVGGLTGMVLAEDIFSLVDSPSRDVSLKDGYAVISADIDGASEDSPVRLKLKGAVDAGAWKRIRVFPGSTVKVMSGAVIPGGATAVVSREFASDNRTTVTVFNDAQPGRNILKKGSDITRGERVVSKGKRLSPLEVGLI